MDYNPDTINKLIGAKVASYKSLSKDDKTEKKEKLEDVKLKKDIHVNDTPYKDIEPAQEEAKSKRELRVEEAYSFLYNELDDIYDDVYGDEAETAEDIYSNEKYIQGIQDSVGKIAQGGPTKKFYQTKAWHKRNVNKWLGKRRRELVGNAAAIAGDSKGYNPEQAKEAALLADKLATPVRKAGSKLASNTAKKVINSVSK